MGLETRLVLTCDNGCGAEEDYTDANYEPEDLPDAVTLPEGWARNYNNGDSILGHVCAACIEEFGEGGY